MESVGKFEFSRKHLIGHGAFAVVFKGRHKEKREWEVAVKCISKKNLAKSQSLLGKEIKILKELKHENIVRLLDYQEIGGYVYLVMEYCNGGDLAEYLHSKGTLSEDTIRIFLQQIAQAMKVLQIKGILHRDLKPQNILLCRPDRRKCSPVNICIKLADFGFARHLQTNTMAATLCGSPMYMAPEVIMSQHYDAKADLWSIGTIVYQCLTGKAPFHASTPQELRLFYESNATLLPRIPKETSRNLRHLLVGMLQRNHKQRISFDEFFHHPFLETNSSTKKSSPAQLMSYPSSGSGSSSSGSSTSHPASPQFSKGEVRRPQPKERASPKQESPVLTPKEIAKEDKGSTSYSEEFVVVPCQYTCVGEMVSLIDSCLIYSGDSLPDERDSRAVGKTPPPSPRMPSTTKPVSKPVECGQSNYSQAVPIPVPTQIQNYQLMEQKLQPVRKHSSKRATCCRADGKCTQQCRSCGRPGFLNTPELATGGALPQQSSPPMGTTPKTTEQTLPPSSRTGLITVSPDMQDTSSPKHVHSRMPNRTRNVKDLQYLLTSPATQTSLSRKPHNKKGSFRRSLSTGMLSEMLLKAVFGNHLFQEGTDETPNFEKTPPTGFHRGLQCSPPAAVFTIGFPSKSDSPQMISVSPSYINSPWLPNNLLQLGGSRRNSQSEAMDASPPSCVLFHPPELPADTLMEQPHIDALSDLRFTLAFVHCIMEFASSKGPGPGSLGSPDVSFLEQSLVTDQISLLSKEWSYSEQLVLYMKAEEFLSSALHAAKKDIIQGQLHPYASVKQVIRKLNELYKNCVTYCRALNCQLETFLLDKQKLMEHFNGLSVEKLLYSHTVHMVQSAALDEMFHYGTTSVQRYHKALLLMEGLSRIMIEPKDVESIDKCKECIERRLSALQA